MEQYLSIPFDQYQRYKLVSDIINKFRNTGESFRILEVGAGFEENLKKFLPNDIIYYIDKDYPSEYSLKENYIVGDILKVELTEKYDFVVAIDVYEHISQIDRNKFVDSLITSSKIATVIAAPFDDENIKYCELFANEVYKTSHDSDHIWLKEHIVNGLPSLSLTIDLVKEHHLNPVIIPNGYLPHWFEIISTALLIDGKLELTQMMKTVYEIYNKNYYAYDNRNPAYRQVIVIPKERQDIDFSDLLSKNIDSETFNDNYQLLQSFIKEIKTAYKSNENFLKHAIIAKDTQLQEMTDQIQSLNQTATAKDTQLQEMTDQIQSLNQAATAKDTQLQEMTDQIQSLNQAATAKDTQLQEMTDQVQSLNQEISSIEKSIVWQLTTKFHNRIIERLLPHNSRRRKYYDLARAGGKILINDGYQAFSQSAAQYSHKNDKQREYQKWISQNEPTPDELIQLKDTSRRFSYRPKISIITPVWNTDKKWLRLAIDSVINQVYDNWELCIVDGGSTKRYIKNILKEYAQKDSRIKVKILERNQGIAREFQ